MAKNNDRAVPEGEQAPCKANEANTQPTQVNPDLTESRAAGGVRPRDVYVHLNRPHSRSFRRVGSGHFIATSESDRPEGKFEKSYRAVKQVLIGRPLETAQEINERLTKVKALAVFGSDAISSSAYATEATLVILMVAGNAALGVALYTSLAIAIMLTIVAFSYRQTVYAYPQGGGSYNVSRENLGQLPGLVAAAALLIDYILTVAVSIAAGSNAVISAILASGYQAQVQAFDAWLPPFLNLNVFLTLSFIVLITLGNLRGIRESGTIFAFPTYLFIASLSITLVVGLFKTATGTLAPAVPSPTLIATEPLGLWLILRAFSAGAVAMSGVEAVSNGVPAFQKPESKNAATTLTVMATCLGVFFLGVSFLSTRMGLVPGAETIISQVARAVFGTSLPYYVFQAATTGVLVIAANTAFADFPRLSSVLARDEYLPHQFSFRGDRLAFSTGIIALASIASLLVVAFSGNVERLIHLYAVGVLLAFSMSNLGMVVHWWRLRGPNWKTSLAINGTGAALSIVTLLIVAVTKFALGAWIVILLIPVIVSLLLYVHRHYAHVRKQLRVVPGQPIPTNVDHLVVLPIDEVDYASLRAIAFARTISRNAVILHVSTHPEQTEELVEKVRTYAADMKLVVVDSPLRALVRPLLAYVDAVHSQDPTAFVTIVLPEVITAHWQDRFLHNRSAALLRNAFEKHPNVAVVLVPYLLEQ